MKSGEFTLLLTDPGSRAGVNALFQQLAAKTGTLTIYTSPGHRRHPSTHALYMPNLRGEDFTIALAAELDRRPGSRLLAVEDFSAVMPADDAPEVTADFLDHCWQPLLDYAGCAAVITLPVRIFRSDNSVNPRAVSAWMIRNFTLLDHARSVIACQQSQGQLHTFFIKEHHRLLLRAAAAKQEELRHA